MAAASQIWSRRFAQVFRMLTKRHIRLDAVDKVDQVSRRSLTGTRISIANVTKRVSVLRGWRGRAIRFSNSVVRKRRPQFFDDPSALTSHPSPSAARNTDAVCQRDFRQSN